MVDVGQFLAPGERVGLVIKRHIDGIADFLLEIRPGRFGRRRLGRVALGQGEAREEG